MVEGSNAGGGWGGRLPDPPKPVPTLIQWVLRIKWPALVTLTAQPFIVPGISLGTAVPLLFYPMLPDYRYSIALRLRPSVVMVRATCK